MLVITRRHNEELMIGGDIRIRVVGVRGQRVQLGIEAPVDVSVRRPETPAEQRVFEAPRRVPAEADPAGV